MTNNDITDPADEIFIRIAVIRRQRVLLDSTLARLFGVSTSRLNEQFRRNKNRFPADFAFEITRDEMNEISRRTTTPKPGRGGRRKLPVAFTEHGAIMAAIILNSPRAVEMTVYVVRAFLQMRSMLASHPELASKLERLEKSLAALDSRTRRQFEEVYAAIRALTALPSQESRPIGFTADLTPHK